MSPAYLITPFAAWVAAGALKFAVNSFRARRLAFDLIGYGGMPSNHSAIVGSVASLIALREGIDGPAFGVAAALAFIVVLDAGGLRRHVGRHAAAINGLYGEKSGKKLRERIGHTRLEILAGLLTGFLTALLVNIALPG